MVKLSERRKKAILRTIWQVGLPALILFINDAANIIGQTQGKYGFIALGVSTGLMALAQNLKNEVAEQRKAQADEAKRNHEEGKPYHVSAEPPQDQR